MVQFQLRKQDVTKKKLHRSLQVETLHHPSCLLGLRGLDPRGTEEWAKDGGPVELTPTVGVLPVSLRAACVASIVRKQLASLLLKGYTHISIYIYTYIHFCVYTLYMSLRSFDRVCTYIPIHI